MLIPADKTLAAALPAGVLRDPSPDRKSVV